MADVDSGDVADDAAARQAAEVAVELSEAGGPADKRRIAARLHGRRGPDHAAAACGAASARRGADTAARRSAATARRGADGARRGASSAGRGVTSGMNWLTGQVVAMGPRLRIRDQATLRAQFPGQSDDEIAQRLIERAARAAAAVGGATGAWAALPVAARVPRRGRGGDAGRRGDRGQARRRTARDLRHGRRRQRRRSGRVPTSDRGRPAAASTRWTAACCSSRDRRWPGS